MSPFGGAVFLQITYSYEAVQVWTLRAGTATRGRGSKQALTTSGELLMQIRALPGAVLLSSLNKASNIPHFQPLTYSVSLHDDSGFWRPVSAAAAAAPGRLKNVGSANVLAFAAQICSAAAMSDSR